MYKQLQTILFVLVCVCWSVSYAQTPMNLTVFPKNQQLYPRDLSTNNGRIEFSGTPTSAYYQSIRLLIYKNDSLVTNDSAFLNSNQSYDFSEVFPAGKFRYKMMVYLNNGISDSLFFQASDLLVGDAILISGQSNATAGNFNYSGFANTNYQDSFIRSFGNFSNIFDSSWYIADGDTAYVAGAVGQWGLVMAKLMLDKYGIPIAIINAARGSSPIEFFQKNRIDPGDTSTNYWKTYNRVFQAGLTKRLRSIMFYQGENDAQNADWHDSFFTELYSDWQDDYSGMVKNYVVQVRFGCGDPSLELREFQRQFEFKLKGVQTMTVNGLNGHDGCHFNFTNGYEELGKNFASVFSRDLHNDTIPNINPLNIKYAYYSNAANTELTLELHNPIGDSLRADSGFFEYFKVIGSNSRIWGGAIRNNKIVLYLQYADCNITGLNYDGATHVGKWVTNLRKVAMLSFYNAPIYKSRPLPKGYNACYMKDIKLGYDSIPGYTYSWLNLDDTSWTSSRAKPIFTPTDTVNIRLIITSTNTSCPNDTLYTKVLTDQVQAEFKGEVYDICDKEFAEINKPKDFVSWEVYSSTDTITSKQFYINGNGSYKVIGKSEAACIIIDSFGVITHNTPIELNDDTSICSYDSVVLGANHGYVSYLWNKIDSNSNYIVSSSNQKWILETEDSFGCLYVDSVIVSAYQAIKPDLGIDVSFCLLDSFTFSVSKDFKVFKWNSDSSNQQFYTTKTDEIVTVSTYDSNTCIASDTVLIVINKLPVFSLGNDTTICFGTSIELITPTIKGYSYLWKDNRTNSSFLVDKAAEYSVQITDANSCAYADSIEVGMYTAPNDFLKTDTSFCYGSSIMISSEIDFPYYKWSNSASSKSITIDSTLTYYLEIIDKNTCRFKDSISALEFDAPVYPIIQNDTSICKGESVFLEPYKTYPSYKWNTGIMNTGITVTNTGTYSIEITDDNACKYADSVALNVWDLPSNFLGNDTSVCRGDSIQISCLKDYSQFTWNTGAKSKSIAVGYASVFTLEVKDNNACSNTESIEVKVNELPTNFLRRDTTICKGDSIQLNSLNAYRNYEWSTGASTRSILVKDSARYTLQVTDRNACVGTESVLIQHKRCNSNISNISNSNVKLYPNPAQNIVTIEGLENAKIIQVFTSNGQLLQTDSLEGLNTYSLQVHDWSRGLYILLIDSIQYSVLVD